MKKSMLPHSPNSKLFSRYLIFLSFLLFSSLGVYSQGFVKGTVTSVDDNSPLVAATIAVKGTTSGVITNFNGEYTLVLKEGTYTIQISYMGYDTKEESVILVNKQTTKLDISLSPMSILSEEVVVTMQAKGQIAAVNQQIQSNQIINVVSEERIRELPDENAAQAISRLPGVHLDGSKVVIRGVESKMNKILINGIEMPSTEGTTRSTDLEMVSANMLSGIEVFKTLTPDMDANAIGGVVNLRLRKASKELHYSATVQGRYNQQEKIFGGYKLWGDVSNRFLNNRLGIVLNLNYESFKGGDDWINTRYSQYGYGEIGKANYMFNDVSVYDQIKMNESIGGSLVIDFDLPIGQLVYTGIVSHSTTEETLHREYIDVGDWHHQFTIDRSRNKRLLLNNSLRLEKQIGIVKLDASISNVSIDSDDEFRYSYKSKEIPGIETFNKDSLIESKKLVMEPWEAYPYIIATNIPTYKGHDAQIKPTVYDENQWLFDLNLQIPVQISDQLSVNFKLGGKHKTMLRYYNMDSYEYNYLNVKVIHDEIKPWLASIGHEVTHEDLKFGEIRDNDYRPNAGFMNNLPYRMDYVIDADIMDEFMLNQINHDKLVTYSNTAEDDYWGGEKLSAAYAMAEINLGKKLVLIPGLRYEYLSNNYFAKKVEQNTMTTWFVHDTLSGTAQHAHLLPHLHLRYRVTNWWDIRFSFNNTLSRPDYKHALPNIFYNVIKVSGTAGNPNIRPAISENFDLNFTFYTRKLGLITLGGYMKNVSDIFYMQPTLLKNIPDSTIIAQFPTETYKSFLISSTRFFFNSPYVANVKGIEAEWQSNFSWLPEPFNGIVLNVNYTRVWSETKYMQDRIKTEIIKEPGSLFPIISTIEVDTFFVNRLLNQANDIANVSLGYDYKGFSARFSFRYQGNVISGIGTRPEENEYTNDIYAFDFVVKQKIPLKFADFEVFLNAINFTNVPYSRYSTYPNKGNTNTYLRYSGPQFQLGLRIKH